MNDHIKPQILTAQSAQAQQQNSAVVVVELYQRQLQELTRIHNPGHTDPGLITDVDDVWIYYPSQSVLLHCVDEAALFQLRTNRNQLLITQSEQQKLHDSVVGVAGMSVGSGIAIGLSYAGISRTIKIADHDELDTSNLNRLRESLRNVGRSKVDLAAEKIYDVDPFADVHMFTKGVNDQTISRFFDDPGLDLLVDEIDDFQMKVRMRYEAKRRGIPVLMFTSLGDNILVDVERYDQDSDLRPFNGILQDDGAGLLTQQTISPDDIKKYSIKLVGQQYVPTKAIESVFEMGKSLVGRPQLYSTIAVDGGLATYLIRKILLGSGPASGRYFVRFNDLFNLAEDDFADSPERQSLLRRLQES